jgi:integrase
LAADDFIALVAHWQSKKSKSALRNATMATFMFVGMGRFGETARTRVADLTDLGEGKGFNWRIPFSKTDQIGRGALPIPMPEQLDVGCLIGGPIRDFLAVAPPNDGGPLFRSSSYTAETWLPLSPSMMAKGINNGTFNQALRQALLCSCPHLRETIKLYSSHSLRKGGATALYEAGFSIGRCRAVLRHSSEDAVRHYVQPAQASIRASLARIGSAK